MKKPTKSGFKFDLNCNFWVISNLTFDWIHWKDYNWKSRGERKRVDLIHFDRTLPFYLLRSVNSHRFLHHLHNIPCLLVSLYSLHKIVSSTIVCCLLIRSDNNIKPIISSIFMGGGCVCVFPFDCHCLYLSKSLFPFGRNKAINHIDRCVCSHFVGII